MGPTLIHILTKNKHKHVIMWSRQPAMAESLVTFVVILVVLTSYSWTWIPFVVVGARFRSHWAALQITHVLRMIRRWRSFFPPLHAHREFVWGLGCFVFAGLGYGFHARQQMEVGMAISATNSNMSAWGWRERFGIRVLCFKLGIWWCDSSCQRGFTSLNDCHAM